MSKEKCPNCGTSLGQTLISNTYVIEGEISFFIKDFSEDKEREFCNKCYKSPYEEATKKFQAIKTECQDFIEENIDQVPILTVHDPKGWIYKPIEMVTSQSVIGTGVISEIASNWTDFFGTQSNSYRNKLKDGEEFCKKILRLDALNVGGNAVIAADIDYSEAGGGKGMLMVCIAGTAVSSSNLSDFGYNEEILQILRQKANILIGLSKYNFNKHHI
ncbi:heavy metal-binding domain-containing protein [Algoriphagus terrigena]|uniref:heavy metal-binding domain-containing protein n=1 Tax=Algoriphagus terrigena TaxID=344884 RepID=UPI00068505B1|nr:heavy metal-binding domain-containing protein [Algoriphagus terrigena]